MVLRTLSEIAGILGDARLEREALDLAERTGAGRFYVACVGDFKRGKSTLINSLIGTPILPTGAVPVTAVPTVVRFGVTLGARVLLDDWREVEPRDLLRYVTDPGVVAVEVFSPSPLLEEGLCLVDTPGVGSVFAENTAATERFIPHIDAALVVIGADPPMSGNEQALVRAIAPHVSDVLVVLNKSDRVSDDDRRAAVAFAEAIFAKRIGRSLTRIFEVSAARLGPERDWPALVAALRELGVRSLSRAAFARGAQRIALECRRQIAERRGALLQPTDHVRRSVADAARMARTLAPLLEAERAELSLTFARRRETFLGHAITSALAERGAPRDIARRHIEPWLAAEREVAAAAYQHVADHFLEMTNDLLDRLGLPHVAPPEYSERANIRFYFHDLAPLARGDARAYLIQLLSVNATRVQNELDDVIADRSRQLEASIADALAGLAASAERALDSARAALEAGDACVRRELELLDTLARRVDESGDRISG
jgi:GTP-binding protein EngB required for normal cell division